MPQTRPQAENVVSRAYRNPSDFEEVVIQTNEGPKTILVDKRRRSGYEAPKSWVGSSAYSNPAVSAAGVTDNPMSAFGGVGEVIPTQPPLAAPRKRNTPREWYDISAESLLEPRPVGSEIPPPIRHYSLPNRQNTAPYEQLVDRAQSSTPTDLPTTVLGGPGYNRQQRVMPSKPPPLGREIPDLIPMSGNEEAMKGALADAAISAKTAYGVMPGLQAGFNAGAGILEGAGILDVGKAPGSAQDASTKSPMTALSQTFADLTKGVSPQDIETINSGSTDPVRVQAALDAANGATKAMVADPTKALEDQGVDIKATVDDLVKQYQGSATDTDKLLKMDKDEQAEFLVEMGLNMMAIGGRPGSGAMGILGVMGEAGRISLEQRRRNRTKAEIENREALRLEAEVAIKREERAATDRKDAAEQANENEQNALDRKSRERRAYAGQTDTAAIAIHKQQRALVERANQARPEGERLTPVQLDEEAHQRTLAIQGRLATGSSTSSTRKETDTIISRAEALKEADIEADPDAPLDPYIRAAIAERDTVQTELRGPNALPGGPAPARAGLTPPPGSREDIESLMDKFDEEGALTPEEEARINAYKNR